jgi:Transposase and inactivated derivatives, IS30 family
MGESLRLEGIRAIVCKEDGLPRTQIYYCHPYHAWERGSNEQVNGQLRRFIPKGSSIAEYSIEDILKIREWINNYPRRVLNGRSSREVVEGLGELVKGKL